MKLEFKSGDIITCKKDFRDPNQYYTNKLTIPRFLKGHKYKLTYLNYWNEDHTIIVYMVEDYFTFYKTDNFILPFENVVKFEDYFYTKKELRKLKSNNLWK